VTPAILAALALAGAPQAPAPAAPTFGVSVASVYVDVFVTDGGAPLPGLTAADFELRDDGRRKEVELAGTEETPLTTMLVLDVSGSVAGEKLARLRDGVRAVLRGKGAADPVGLVTFDQEVRVHVAPGPDAAAVERALSAVRPAGATALFDAIYAGTIIASDRSRSLLVVFTDGEDNLSWLGAPAVARTLEVSNVLLQVVGVGATGVSVQAEINSVTGRQTGVRTGPGDEPPHVALMRQLAESTGGRFWSASNPAGIAAAFEAMVAAMKTRYVLRFDPGSARRAGRHEIEVKLRGGRRGKVHCRKAYFTGP
jgi:VWFA-related protein